MVAVKTASGKSAWLHRRTRSQGGALGHALRGRDLLEQTMCFVTYSCLDRVRHLKNFTDEIIPK